MRHATCCWVTAGIVTAAIGCGGSSPSAPAGHAARSYRMGFSNFPPAPDTGLANRAVRMWTTRADAAIMHIDPPWVALLAGASADSLVRADILPLAAAYRSLGFTVVIETDVTDGIDRTRESPALTGAGHSVTEAAVQQLYRRYTVALAADVAPDYLGLASETNLVRAAAPAGVYPAVVQMTTAAAADVRGAGNTKPIYVSVQVELAWGRFTGAGGSYIGIDQDRRDFAFIDALGLSSYPYLGAYGDPGQLPADYYARLAGAPALPVLVTEGGWSSASFGPVHSTPARQAAWIARAATLLDSAHAVAWFQLDFTDINLAAFGVSPTDSASVAPFVSIGLVDSTLASKPALAAWDTVFTRRLAR